MTTTTMQGDPPNRVRHSWRCARRSPLIETTKKDHTGRVRVVLCCTGCGHDDMPDRIERDRPDPPAAA